MIPISFFVGLVFCIKYHVAFSVHSICSKAMIPSRIKMSEKDYLHNTCYKGDDFSHVLGYNDPNHIPSRLQLISQAKIRDVILSKTPIDTQGCGIDRSFYVSAEDLEDDIHQFDLTYGKPLNIRNCVLSKHPQMAIATEFKRASPSKGILNEKVDIVEQCLQYAFSSASIISVLTEYAHFKGTLDDMKRVRIATQEALGQVKRPAILRKDFIFDR